MHKYDALIIIAESLPSRQAVDLMRWYGPQEPACLLHPSVQWWINRHASEVSAYYYEQNPAYYYEQNPINHH